MSDAPAEKRNDGGPAFPFQANDVSNLHMQASGMSLRDWFAAQAPEMPHWWMQREIQATQPPGWEEGMTSKDWDRLWDELHFRRIASWRYAFADAMLEARGK